MRGRLLALALATLLAPSAARAAERPTVVRSIDATALIWEFFRAHPKRRGD